MKILFVFILIFSFKFYSFAATEDSLILTGKIIDSSNEPLIGVTILLKGTNFGTVTDIDGFFELKLTHHFIQSDSVTVIFNFPYGYQTQERVYSKSKLLQISFEEKIVMEREPSGIIVVSSKFNKNSKIESVELTPEQILQIQKSPFKGCGSPGVTFEQTKKQQKRKQKNPSH